MKLFEIFITETTEEDRAILSLSSAIYKIIKQYETIDDDGDAWKNKKYNDFDDDEFDDIGEISTDRPIKLGKIGNLVKVPVVVEPLANCNLELQSDYGIRLRMKKEGGEKIKPPESEIIYGLWYADTDTIVLNKDFIGSNTLQTIISHELRHAYDDIKSTYQANKQGGRYSRPKKKEHRQKYENDPYNTDLTAYHAQPSEINARFVEVLHSLVPIIRRAVKLPDIDVKQYSLNQFNNLLKSHKIAYLFPERTQSRDFKRLLKRGVDFIDKEIQKYS